MSQIAPGDRRRSYNVKTRTGSRRVKCDEERPSCRKCSSTGRKCEGFRYGDDYTSARTTTTHPSAGTELPSVLFQSLSLFPNENQKESRAFHFFLRNTAPQLAGFYGEIFWSRFVLQATHYEPVVYHAIVAIGSLHEGFKLSSESSSHGAFKDGFALSHYNFAIRSLVQPLSNAKKEEGRQRPTMDLCLTACILFAHFESMQANYGSAIAHIQSGIKILGEIEYDESTNMHRHEVLRCASIPLIPMAVLLDLFMRVDYQITDRIYIPTDVAEQMMSGRKWYSLKKFAQYRRLPRSSAVGERVKIGSLNEARDELDHLRLRAHLDSRKVDVRLNSAAFAAWKAENALLLQQWADAFEDWKTEKNGCMTAQEEIAVRSLGILGCMCYISLHIVRTHIDDQTAWDAFNPQFDEAVSLAEEMLTLSVVSLDMEIIVHLYGIASRCRDPRIRRRAIEVIKCYAKQEGLWNSWNAALTARVAERVVQIEEEGLGEVRSSQDVPAWARILNVQPNFEKEGRRAKLKYTRMMSENCPYGDWGRTWVEEIVEW